MGTDWTRLTTPPTNTLKASEVGLEPPEHFEPGAWFLGPNGENAAEMGALLSEALLDHANARHEYWPEDPPFISDDVRKSEAFTKTFATMRANLKSLSRALRSSTPMSSYRNKSHMNWDITMPGALGYFAGMMFNANNVAPEASPVTTVLELQAGMDLSHMLGFGATGAPEPWGHITCDGSIANTEAMWAARNLRYQGAALARAIRLEAYMAPARNLAVHTAQGNFTRILDLEPWDLVNLPNDVILDLPRRLVEDAGLSQADVRRALDSYSLQALGMVAFHQDVLQGLSPGIVIVPATAHYSWDKGVTILGLGKRALRHVPVDLDARMTVSELRKVLDACIDAQVPVIQVVALAGSTAESAVDPIAAIAGLRAEYAFKGLSFALQADAAWGGYFTSMLRAASGPFGATPVDPLSPYVKEQLEALKDCDTITIDPHKSGYLPYPAGALCYRDKRMIYLVAHEAPVVFHDGDAPSVGVYGIEGSKPGAAAAGVALSHTTIPLNKSGYGALLGRCIFNAKRFYSGVITLAEKDDPFFAVPVQRLPAEREGKPPEEIAAQRGALRALRPLSNEDLVRKLDMDPDLARLFSEIGPDLTVFPYAFNFLLPDGTVNTDPLAMNALNAEIFRRMSVQTVAIADAPPRVPMLVTSTLFPPELYGDAFISGFCERARVTVPEGPVRVLISTMQDPWVSDTARGDFIPTLMDILRTNVLEARDHILNEKG
jgi:glutamate/tyrosine decarboxylase-like PLP-dependent enzyme